MFIPFEGVLMATVYKVLGQSNPAATTNTTLYTAPASTSAVVSTITICNQASSAATYRIAVRPAGATAEAKHYIVYGATVAGSDSTALTLGITLATTDVITVYASTATLSFNAYGSEIS
jgi:glucose-6-phosphate dehydrogenase assembly protein OpcA